MPATVGIACFAIIAKDIDTSRHVWRNRLQFNTRGNRVPSGGHVFGCFRRFLTYGTLRRIRAEFFVTMPMQRVLTRQFMRRKATTEQIFLTHGAIAHVLARLTIVIIKEFGIDAHATIITMTKVFATTHPTKSASFTMIGRFRVGHPQVTNVAMILPKLNTT